MELQSTFPQRILFELRVNSQVNTVMSKLIQRTSTTKTTTSTMSAITASADDDANANTTTVFSPTCSMSPKIWSFLSLKNQDANINNVKLQASKQLSTYQWDHPWKIYTWVQDRAVTITYCDAAGKDDLNSAAVEVHQNMSRQFSFRLL